VKNGCKNERELLVKWEMVGFRAQHGIDLFKDPLSMEIDISLAVPFSVLRRLL
jgi:hypothetical protein